MAPVREFAAPWSRLLVGLTIGVSCLLVGTAVVVALTAAHEPLGWLPAALPLLLLLLAVPFAIRGFTLAEDALYVRRLGWRSRIDLTGLRGVEVDREAMARSVRTFGNGGLFCFAGAYRNRRLGAYRAFATDPALAVVLRFERRIVVVTPARPRDFAAALAKRIAPARS